MNKVSFGAAKFTKIPQIKPRTNKNTAKFVDEINSTAMLKGKSKEELNEHLIRELAASPRMGFSNLPIIRAILGAAKDGTKIK